jgi:hypothetical protein
MKLSTYRTLATNFFQLDGASRTTSILFPVPHSSHPHRLHHKTPLTCNSTLPPETSKLLQNRVTSPHTVPNYLFPSTLKPYLGPLLPLLSIPSSSSPLVLKIEKLSPKNCCYFEFQLMNGARWTSSSQYISLEHNSLLSSKPKMADTCEPKAKSTNLGEGTLIRRR